MGLQHIQAFPFTMLKHITNDFSAERVIGLGGSGVVYKGVLDNGEVIAVKKFHNHYDSSGKKLGNGESQFLNELMNLFGVQHPNIIRLVGYCYETRSVVMECDGKRVLASEEERAICLEYMQGGGLKDHLSDESCGLEWHARYNIIKGICEGLKYLHTGCENPIYHLDLKPENIWLDGKMIPKIGDFGISRLPAGSMQTYATKSAVSGTIGYMAPEYIGWNQISQKCDVYSLGFTMIRIIAGEKGYQNYDPLRPLEEFIERVHENWCKRQKETMSLHSLQQVKTCTRIALRCVEFDREKRPTITDIVDELNKVDAAQSSAIGGQSMKEEDHTTLEKQSDIKGQKEKHTKHMEEKMKEQVDGRSAASPLHIRGSGIQEQDIHGHVLHLGSREQIVQDHVWHLQSGLQRLKDTLPTMYDLIDRAEWRNLEYCIAEILPKLKDAVYDADDLLDEFRWCEMKVELEGNAGKSPFTDFVDIVIQGSYNKLNDFQGRLDHLSSQLEKLGLRDVKKHFDKSVRPETSSIPNEKTIFGRDSELKKVMEFLVVPKYSKGKRARSPVNASTSITTINQLSNDESRMQSLPVLPIVGIGGVGKTTLAQHICSHKQVKSHFDFISWIFVSNDFDAKRLIKEVIRSSSEIEATADNLDILQRDLSNHVKYKRFLIVLDDMWDDSLKENGQLWKKFCAPLKSAQEGSIMLVTTRCRNVADGVGTMQPIILEGLMDDVFWNFFKFCAFGSESSSNYHELEDIGKQMVPKLKGSPLAAKTLGRMLRMDLQETHWNSILENELWELRQDATDILPALRLSYMYLPLRLKRCFAFCAMYPKDTKFIKEDLAEIWAAEGFVEPEGAYPIHVIGCLYFEDLVSRSFFQRVSGHYVIHDLLHDMAQKVSEHDCFILRNKNDFCKVPENVRHIYILKSSDVFNSDLMGLCKYTKLRTILCEKQLFGSNASSVMEQWCAKLLCIRVVSLASANLPDSIGNWKHLRYLKIEDKCPLSFPSTFCWLYHLQILDAREWKVESLPPDFSKLVSLKRFTSEGFKYYPGCHIFLDAADTETQRILRLIKNLNQFCGNLVINNLERLSKDHAAEAELMNTKYLYELKLNWMYWSTKQHGFQIMQDNATEVLQVLHPPISLTSLFLQNYPGVSLPSWFQPQNLPSLTSLDFRSCRLLNSIHFSIISQNNSDDSIDIFRSLSKVTIFECVELSSLESFLHPDYVPVIKDITLMNCKSLASVPTERFQSFRYLRLLRVIECPCLKWQRGLKLPSTLQTLELTNCGDFSACVPGCLENLTSLVLLSMEGCQGVTSIPGIIWRRNLALLKDLRIRRFPELVSIGGAEAIGEINNVNISDCPKLLEREQIWQRRFSWYVSEISVTTSSFYFYV